MSEPLDLHTTIQTLLAAKTSLRGLQIVLADDKDAQMKFAKALSDYGLVALIATKAGKTAPEFQNAPMLVSDHAPVVELYENLAFNRERDTVSTPANLAARLALTGMLTRQVVRQVDTNAYWWLLTGDGSHETDWAPFLTIYSAAYLIARTLHFADTGVQGAVMLVTGYDFGPGFKTDEFRADLSGEINLVTRVTFDPAAVT